MLFGMLEDSGKVIVYFQFVSILHFYKFRDICLFLQRSKLHAIFTAATRLFYCWTIQYVWIKQAASCFIAGQNKLYSLTKQPKKKQHFIA